MTTPTPAAQKAAEAICHEFDAHQLLYGPSAVPADNERICVIIEREMNQWLPESQAPRDGTPVWCYWGDDQVRMQWLESEEYQGWIFSDPDMQDICPAPCPPSHFRYLPPPPCTAKP